MAAAAGLPQVSADWADSAFVGELVAWAQRFLRLTIKVVAWSAGRAGLVVLLLGRWVVDRTQSWLLRARRTVRDHERLVGHSESHLTWAAITLMTARLTRRPAHTERIRAA